MNNIDINSMCIATAIYDSRNVRLASNKFFDELFQTEMEMSTFELFIFDNINEKHFIYEIGFNKYFVSNIEISKKHDYIITLENADQLNDIVRSRENEFYEILNAIRNYFAVINKDGVIVEVMGNFNKLYDFNNDDVIGRTIYEMEERKIFNPSVAIRAFKSGKPETMLQLTHANKYLVCTALPIKDTKNEVLKVICYTTDEILKNEYNKLSDTYKALNIDLSCSPRNKNTSPNIIGNSDAINKVISTVNKISIFDTNVLFTGNSGVGKTIFARLTHAKSNRRNGPFIEINCGAIPENLLESELFGYEKGSFTGANKEGKMGLIELAKSGTLFLDEIGDLSLHMQVKLLKAIQEKRITRVGGTESITVDFRLISATSKNLKKMVKNGEFREELFYRINVITINIPNLNERREDIHLLCKHFLEKFNNKYGLNKILSKTALDYLTKYNWPGNIRELENTIEMLVLTTEDNMILEEHLPIDIKSGTIDITDKEIKTLKNILEKFEKEIILNSYKKHKTTIGVAKELGISQSSASLKINKYTCSENV